MRHAIVGEHPSWPFTALLQKSALRPGEGWVAHYLDSGAFRNRHSYVSLTARYLSGMEHWWKGDETVTAMNCQETGLSTLTVHLGGKHCLITLSGE